MRIEIFKQNVQKSFAIDREFEACQSQYKKKSIQKNNASQKLLNLREAFFTIRNSITSTRLSSRKRGIYNTNHF